MHQLKSSSSLQLVFSSQPPTLYHNVSLFLFERCVVLVCKRFVIAVIASGMFRFPSSQLPWSINAAVWPALMTDYPSNLVAIDAMPYDGVTKIFFKTRHMFVSWPDESNVSFRLRLLSMIHAPQLDPTVGVPLFHFIHDLVPIVLFSHGVQLVPWR